MVYQEHEPPALDSSTLDLNPFWMNGQSYLQPQYQRQPRYLSKVHFMEDYVAMLTEDGDKLMEKSVKKMGDEIIDGYAANRLQQPSLPPLRDGTKEYE